MKTLVTCCACIIASSYVTAALAGTDDDAKSLFAALASGDWPKVLGEAQAWHHSEPENGIPVCLCAYACLSCRDYVNSTEYFLMLSNTSASESLYKWLQEFGESHPDSALSSLLTGDALAREGKYEEAIHALDTAIQLDSKSSLAYDVRGVTKAIAGDTENATKDFETAISLDSTNADAWLNVGLLELEKGQLQQSVASLTKAIQLAPDYALAYNARGVAYWRQGDCAKATAEIEQAAILQESNSVFESNLRTLESSGLVADFRQTLDHAQAAIKPGGIVRTDYTFAVFGTGINAESDTLYATNHSRFLTGSGHENERWVYVAFKGNLPLAGVEKVSVEHPEWNIVVVDPRNTEQASAALKSFVTDAVSDGKQPRMFIDINKWIPQQLRLDAQDRTIDIPANLIADANQAFHAKALSLGGKPVSLIAGHSDFTQPLEHAVMNAEGRNTPFAVAIVESNRSESRLRDAITTCPRTQIINIQPKAGDFSTQEAQLNPSGYQETLRSYRSDANKYSNYTLLEIDRIGGIGNLFVPGETHSDPASLGQRFDWTIVGRQSFGSTQGQGILGDVIREQVAHSVPSLAVNSPADSSSLFPKVGGVYLHTKVVKRLDGRIDTSEVFSSDAQKDSADDEEIFEMCSPFLIFCGIGGS